MQIGNIRIIPTPGHTPGHVCILYKGMLFVGDLVENKKNKIIPYPNSWNWNTEVLNKSIDKVDNNNDINFEWILTAHGKPVKQNKLIK